MAGNIIYFLLSFENMLNQQKSQPKWHLLFKLRRIQSILSKRKLLLKDPTLIFPRELKKRITTIMQQQLIAAFSDDEDDTSIKISKPHLVYGGPFRIMILMKRRISKRILEIGFHSMHLLLLP